MTSLVTPAGRLDRRAVMTEAHRQFRLMRRYGWSSILGTKVPDYWGALCRGR